MKQIEQKSNGKERRRDVRIDTLKPWNHYQGVEPVVACERLYARAEEMSQTARNWYWSSISAKRKASIAVRVLSFLLLLAGATLPVLSALWGQPGDRLVLTQLGIIALALAGLLQAGDKVFGWSTGWLRYATTVLAMETATRNFELAWAAYLLAKEEGELTHADKHHLFLLARNLQDELLRLQREETDKWVGEFNTSLGLLNDLIRSQRDSAEQTASAARAALAAKEATAERREESSAAGAIELTIARATADSPLRIRLDDRAAEEFDGSVWSCVNVPPGFHKLEIADPLRGLRIQRVALVPAGGVVKIEAGL